MINERIGPDNDNEWLNELLDDGITYQRTVNERIIERECWKNYQMSMNDRIYQS